jgi:hypothetical protein
MIASRKAQNLNLGITQKLNHFIVNDHFAKLKTTMEELGVMNKPECIILSIKDVDCAFKNSPL